MFRFLNSIRVKVLKMFSTFSHNLDIRYNERSTKFVIFQTSFEFYTILKPFCDTIFIMIREQNI
jgi:hypothetical protein